MGFDTGGFDGGGRKRWKIEDNGEEREGTKTDGETSHEERGTKTDQGKYYGEGRVWVEECHGRRGD